MLEKRIKSLIVTKDKLNIPLSNKFYKNTLIVHFMELEYFTNVKYSYTLYVDYGFDNCSNLETLGTKNILYTSTSARVELWGYTYCYKIDHLETYNFIGAPAVGGSNSIQPLARMRLRYALLPRISGKGGDGHVSMQYCGENKFLDFGALVKSLYCFYGGEPDCIVFRSPTKITLSGSNGYGYRSKVFVHSNLIEEYLSDSNWTNQVVKKVNGVYQIFAIGGTEWQEQFASTSNPASEYADVEYYAPESYDEYVEGYEESKAAAAAAATT